MVGLCQHEESEGEGMPGMPNPDAVGDLGDTSSDDEVVDSAVILIQ